MAWLRGRSRSRPSLIPRAAAIDQTTDCGHKDTDICTRDVKGGQHARRRGPWNVGAAYPDTLGEHHPLVFQDRQRCILNVLARSGQHRQHQVDGLAPLRVESGQQIHVCTEHHPSCWFKCSTHGGFDQQIDLRLGHAEACNRRDPDHRLHQMLDTADAPTVTHSIDLCADIGTADLPFMVSPRCAGSRFVPAGLTLRFRPSAPRTRRRCSARLDRPLSPERPPTHPR